MFRPGRVRMYVHDKGRKPGVIERHDASFGTRLRRLREAAGLTQEELAERAGLSAKGISDLERGERPRPYPHTVRSLADALKLSGDERASLLASVPRRSATAPAPSKMALGSRAGPRGGNGPSPSTRGSADHAHGRRWSRQDAPRPGGGE